MSVSDNIHGEIQNITTDIRAEVIIDQLIQKNIFWNELFVHTDKFFYRNFSKDIFTTNLDVENNYRDILHIHLSRAGMYDLLPEGIFFQPNATSKKIYTAVEMAEEYKINKKKEAELRNFFSPLENEFFYHRVKNYQAEKQILGGLSNDSLNKYYIKFWNLAKDISPLMALRLTLLLPYVHQIAGDENLMASSLQNIISERVTCTVQHVSNQYPKVSYNVLGKHHLGNNFICGNNYEEDEIYFVFAIGDLKKSMAQDYLEGGRYYKTIETFYRFFMPANASVKTEILLSKQKKQMYIGSMEEATLGIATVI